MTIKVTVKTTKENGATVERVRGPGGTIQNVPKDSEEIFNIWGEGFLIIRETK